jgi:prepilin-type processing-associated H-X9-DG protein
LGKGIVTGADFPYWPDILQPYVKSKQIFQCPSTSATFPGMTSDFRGRIGYAYNQANVQNDYIVYDDGSLSYGVSMAKFGHPSTTIVLSDGFLYNGPWFAGSATDNKDAQKAVYGDYNPNTPVKPADNSTFTLLDGDHTTDRVYRAHFDGANYAFADGHVKWMKNTTLGMWTANS